MKTVGEISKELNTHPRNILTALEASQHYGTSIAGWINYVRELPTAADVAKQFGLAESTIRRGLDRWFKEKGIKPEWFIYYQFKDIIRGGRRIKLTIRTMRVPGEFIERLGREVELAKMETLNMVARRLKIPRGWIMDKFRDWCKEHGTNPDDYFYRAQRLPPEFVRELELISSGRD